MTSAVNNLIDQGLGLLHTTAGVEIVYARGSDEVTINDAIPGDQFRGAMTEAGVSVESLSGDWMIEAAKLSIPNIGLTEPMPGDLIKQTIETAVWTYEVMPLFNGDTAWKWLSPAHTRYRTHTRLKGVV